MFVVEPALMGRRKVGLWLIGLVALMGAQSYLYDVDILR